MTHQHLATITILVNDRQKNSGQVNELLTANGRLIIARLGVNIQRQCVENCLALMTVVVDGSEREIEELTGQLNGLAGVKAKYNIMTK